MCPDECSDILHIDLLLGAVEHPQRATNFARTITLPIGIANGQALAGALVQSVLYQQPSVLLHSFLQSEIASLCSGDDLMSKPLKLVIRRRFTRLVLNSQSNLSLEEAGLARLGMDVALRCPVDVPVLTGARVVFPDELHQVVDGLLYCRSHINRTSSNTL